MSRDYIGDRQGDVAWSLRSIRDSLEKLVELLETHLTVTENSHEEDANSGDHRGTDEPVPDRGRGGDSLRDAPATPLGGVRPAVDMTALAKALVRPYGHDSARGQCRACGDDGVTVGRLYEPEAIAEEYADLVEFRPFAKEAT